MGNKTNVIITSDGRKNTSQKGSKLSKSRGKGREEKGRIHTHIYIYEYSYTQALSDTPLGQLG